MKEVTTVRALGVSSTSVHLAAPEDAVAIARVHVQAWRESFTHILLARTLAGLDVGEAADTWTATLLDPSRTTHAGVLDGEIVGFILTGPTRDDDAPRALELQMLYVLDAAKGTGLGQQLVDAGIGDASASLWCADLNLRARAFYERNGFVADGATKTIERWDNVLNNRMVR